MQPRRTPLETHKRILLANTEAKYIRELLDGLQYHHKHKLTDLAEIVEAFNPQANIINQLIAQYNTLARSLINLNEQEQLDSLYRQASATRESLTALHQKLVNQIETLLQTDITPRKQLLQNTLAEASEYRKNVSMLENGGQLERARIGGTDFSDLQRSRQILRDEMNYLQHLSLTFNERFLDLQRRTSNALRFAGKFTEHLGKDKIAIKREAAIYKTHLDTLRQTIMGACNTLLTEFSDTLTAVRNIEQIMEKVNPIPRLPQPRRVDPSELVSKRLDDVSEKQLAAIRGRSTK